MKKTMVVMLIALVGLFVAAQQGYCVDVPVSASITNSSPEMVVVIKQLGTANQDPNTGTTVTTMNFGTLTHMAGTVDTGCWFSTNYFAALMYTNSFGKKYEVRSSCSGLSNGTTYLPATSFGIVPAYWGGDMWDPSVSTSWQGPNQNTADVTSGAIKGTAGTAVASLKPIYTSEPAGSNRIIRAFYSIPPPAAVGQPVPFTGYAPMPLSQAPGTYTGTVAITIAAI